MKKTLFVLFAVTAVVILAGCPSGTYTVGDLLEITVDSAAAELNADGVLDFGIVKAQGGSETVSLTVTNTGDETISVTSIEISDTANYSLELPALPGSVAPGETTQYSLTFAPAGSGDIPATVSIVAQDFAEPAELEVTGEGNYTPVPLFGVTVSGAGTVDANGFYERDGFRTSGSVSSPATRPLYTKTGTPNFHIYIYNASDDQIWGLDDSLDADYPVWPLYSAWDASTSMLPPESASLWAVDDGGAEPPPSLTIQDIGYTDPFTGETLTASYVYFDEEGDPEAAGTAAFQWYRGDSPTGTFSAISGATNMTYTTTGSDDGKYLKVGITLTAETGITAGEEVLSSPTIQFSSPG